MSNKTLIIAEDDESIRLVTSRYLQDLGYEIFMATNLKELWKLIESNKGDVLITDVMLPDGELFDILPQIVEYRENLPVIVVSAKNNLQTAISATSNDMCMCFFSCIFRSSVHFLCICSAVCSSGYMCL